MSEMTAMMLILAFRVLLVGAFLLALPRITRKGLLFGAYVGEELADGEEAYGLRRGWSRACVMLMLLSLTVGVTIGLLGRPLAGNLTGTAILLLGGALLYLRWHSGARELVSPDAARQAARASAPVLESRPQGTVLAALALSICIVASVAAFLYALISHRSMTATSFVAIMLVPGLNLLIAPFFAVFALLTATAKRSIRGGTGGRSIEAQNVFRATVARTYGWTALVICAFMTLLTMEIVRLALSETQAPRFGIFWLGGVALALLLGN